MKPGHLWEAVAFAAICCDRSRFFFCVDSEPDKYAYWFVRLFLLQLPWLQGGIYKKGFALRAARIRAPPYGLKI